MYRTKTCALDYFKFTTIALLRVGMATVGGRGCLSGLAIAVEIFFGSTFVFVRLVDTLPVLCTVAIVFRFTLALRAAHRGGLTPLGLSNKAQREHGGKQ